MHMGGCSSVTMSDASTNSSFSVENLKYGAHPDQTVDIFTPTRAASSRGKSIEARSHRSVKARAARTDVPAARGGAGSGRSILASDVEAPADGLPGHHVAVLLVHGGFWAEGYRRDLMAPLARDLASKGFLTFNVEYRRVGGSGGWPATLHDVSAAVAFCADEAERRGLAAAAERLVAVGHSAGGHLAAWAALRKVDSSHAVRPFAVVSQAGVLDLADAQRRGVGGRAVASLLGADPGDSETWEHRCSVASPIELLASNVDDMPLFGVIHGGGDRHVPVRQSKRFVDAAQRCCAGTEVDGAGAVGKTKGRDDSRATSRVNVAVIDDEEHFAHLDPTSRCWRAALSFIAEADSAARQRGALV